MPLWICTQHNWRSHCSCTAAHHHHQNSHLFVAVLESVHKACNLGWMLPVKLLEDYQSFIFVRFGCSCFSVHGPYENPFRKENTKWVLISIYYFLLCLFRSVSFAGSSSLLSCQRRPASVFAVPPWSTRCLLRSWVTSCRVTPEAATWPGTTAVARRQHTHAPSNYCSSPAQRASRYEDVHTYKHTKAVRRSVFSACELRSVLSYKFFFFWFFRSKKTSGQFIILEKQI